jgi:hypothetical protein
VRTFFKNAERVTARKSVNSISHFIQRCFIIISFGKHGKISFTVPDRTCSLPNRKRHFKLLNHNVRLISSQDVLNWMTPERWNRHRDSSHSRRDDFTAHITEVLPSCSGGHLNIVAGQVEAKLYVSGLVYQKSRGNEIWYHSLATQCHQAVYSFSNIFGEINRNVIACVFRGNCKHDLNKWVR